jgi:hypothetical protein
VGNVAGHSIGSHPVASSIGILAEEHLSPRDYLQEHAVALLPEHDVAILDGILPFLGTGGLVLSQSSFPQI